MKRLVATGGSLRMRVTMASLLLVGALALPAVTPAAPAVTVKGRAVPIPGFARTGNYFGAGADVRAEVTPGENTAASRRR